MIAQELDSDQVNKVFFGSILSVYCEGGFGAAWKASGLKLSRTQFLDGLS